MSALTVTTAPTIEAVALAAAAEWLRLGDIEDVQDIEPNIGGLLKAARITVEKVTNRTLCTTVLKLTLDGWPACRAIRLQHPRPAAHTFPQGLPAVLCPRTPAHRARLWVRLAIAVQPHECCGSELHGRSHVAATGQRHDQARNQDARGPLVREPRTNHHWDHRGNGAVSH